jgi:hypothetical protein
MSFITTVQAYLRSEPIKRTVKTVVEVVAAQTALYTTVIPTAPKPSTSAAVAGGAGVLSFLWNNAVVWYHKSQAAKAAKFEAAFAAAVQAAVAAAEAQHAASTVPHA